MHTHARPKYIKGHLHVFRRSKPNTLTQPTYPGGQLIVQFDGQFCDVEHSFERRYVLVGRLVLHFLAEVMRSQPEIVAEKQL